MTIYIGYPVTYETACQLFRVDNNVEKAIKDAGLELHSTDKGQTILGFRIPETEQLCWNFKKIDDIVILLLEYKTKFKNLLLNTGINLYSFKFYEMEGDETYVTNPEPCVFTY